jgi:hypothetical protein
LETYGPAHPSELTVEQLKVDLVGVIGEHWRNVQTNNGGGRERQRAYRERKQGGL